MKEYTMEEISQALSILDNIREVAIDNPEYGFDDDWITFVKKMRVLTPQSSGSRIQNYIFRALGWGKISPLLNKPPNSCFNTIPHSYSFIYSFSAIKIFNFTPVGCLGWLVGFCLLRRLPDWLLLFLIAAVLIYSFLLIVFLIKISFLYYHYWGFKISC